MPDELEELERATARLLECGPEEMAGAAAERAAAIAGLAGRGLRESEAKRARAAMEAAENAIRRVRAWRDECRAELEHAEQARRYGAALGRVGASKRRRIDLEG